MGFTDWKFGLNDTAAFPALKPGFK